MKKIVHILFFCFLSFQMLATHSAGMELTYECLGNNNYEFTMKLIRFCGGVNVPDEYYLNVSSESCGLTETAILTKIGVGEDITPVCVGATTNCQDPNSPLPGYEQYIFKGVVTLDAPCEDWRAVVCDHSRNSDISTLVSPGSSSLCVYALVNNKNVGCNNSAQFLNNPNAFVCLNNNLCFNNTVIDPDGDVLTYELTEPLKCQISGGCYSNNYTDFNDLIPVDFNSSNLSAEDPFIFAPPIDFDPVSGNFCINPSGIEKTVVAMKVKEYRGGVLISEVIRDIQVVVFNCSNQVPQISGFNGSSSSATDTTTEVGNTISFDVQAFDPDGQGINMTTANLPNGSSFTINQNTGTFSWTPTINDIGIHCFTVEVNDLSSANCDYFLTASKSFCIEVFECLNNDLEIELSALNFCANDSVFDLTTNPAIGNNVWMAQGVVNNNQYDPSQVTSGLDTLTLINTLGACSKTFSEIIEVFALAQANATASDSAVCLGATVHLGVSGLPTGSEGGLYTFEWSHDSILNDPTSISPIAQIDEPTTFYVSITDLITGCVTTDSVFIDIYAHLPVAQVSAQDTLCFGGSIVLEGQNISFPSNTDSFAWYFNADTLPSGNAQLSFTGSSEGWMVLEITNDVGCSDLDSVFLSAADAPILQFSEDSLCSSGSMLIGTDMQINAGTAPYTYNWDLSQVGLITDSDSVIVLSPLFSGWITLEVSDAKGCMALDSQYISTQTNLVAHSNDLNAQACVGDDVIIGGSPSVTGGTPPYQYQWYTTQMLSDYTSPNPSTVGLQNNGLFVLEVTDNDGCVDLDSLELLFNTNAPIVEAGFGEDTLCTSSDIMLGGSPTVIGGNGPFQISWSPSGSLDLANSLNPIASPNQTNVLYTLSVVDADGCLSQDQVYVTFNLNGVIAQASDADTLCSAGTILLGMDDVAQGGIPPYDYQWMPEGLFTDPTHQSQVLSGIADTLVFLNVTDLIGCSDLDWVYISSDNNGLTADAGGQNGDLCATGLIDLGGNPSANAGVAPYTYQWYTQNTPLNDNALSNPTANITQDDFFTLQVIDAQNCQDVDTVYVNLSEMQIDAGFGHDTLCIVSEQQLGGNPTVQLGTPPYSYEWSSDSLGVFADSQNPFITYQGNQMYTLQVIDAVGCISYDSVYIAWQEINASFTPFYQDQIIPAEVEFLNTSVSSSNNALNYIWDFGDSTFSDLENPDHLYTSDQHMTVFLVAYLDSNQFCADTFGYTLSLYPSSQIVVPNVFTPNGDGFNDAFQVDNQGIDVFECILYNRWGTEIYRFDELNNSWDGRAYSGEKLPDGTYFYSIEASGHDGKELSLKGAFSLLR